MIRINIKCLPIEDKCFVIVLKLKICITELVEGVSVISFFLYKSK